MNKEEKILFVGGNLDGTVMLVKVGSFGLPKVHLHEYLSRESTDVIKFMHELEGDMPAKDSTIPFIQETYTLRTISVNGIEGRKDIYLYAVENISYYEMLQKLVKNYGA